MPAIRKLLLTIGLLMAISTPEAQAASDPENTLILETKYGPVVIAMLPELAPEHVARIKELVREGFYDGLVFHRVMEGFMAQTGDPRGDGTGGSGQNLPAEFSDEPFERGVVGMARSSDPNSGDSQFFIMLDSNSGLNGNYTVWGRVTEGMEAIDQIEKAPPGSRSGRVQNPDKIISLKVAADLE